ncbi:hypothetical protein PsorP6_011818 [Peronosclerospora sorghi]|uniref:Uncharacterized protein n=1 Tax=Peronosclerospora sorghi TaxID=230839 RepID=A0ACC0WKR8_9STRA|nr:hypothetical protein PsorP6_011818 [Peronosclerospora sorghi]
MHEHGILPHTSAPYSPQQNGIAKRANRSIAEMARAMIYYQHLDREWWGEAVMTAVYTINRLSNSARDYTTPHEFVWNAKPLM